MKTLAIVITLVATVSIIPAGMGHSAEPQAATKSRDRIANSNPTPDMEKLKTEVEDHYGNAHPEIKEYIIWTAQSFGPNGFWLHEDAFSNLPVEKREKRIKHLSTLFNDAEYGRHLCKALAEAGALKDDRMVPGLIKIAGYHLQGRDYDCRAKWMAVAALARQESDEAVPVLVSLVDHGNQNTRFWARAALTRKTGQDFKQDKLAWAKWWQEQGHAVIEEKFLQPAEEIPADKK